MKRTKARWVKRVGIGLVAVFALLGVRSLIPEAQVGHWRTAEGQQAYAEANRTVMAGLPAPTRILDVPISFGTVRVYEWRSESSGRPVVLLPGMRSGAAMWAENLPGFIGHRTVYAFDALGDAGFSAQTVPLRSFDDQGEWIAETISALNVGKVHLVGHSFGGANATITAVRHPELMASLTLLEPVMVVRPLPASTYFWATVASVPFLPQSWHDHGLAKLGGVTVEEVRRRSPLGDMIGIASSEYSSTAPLPRNLSDDEWRGLTMPVRLDIGGRSELAGGAGAVERLREVRPHTQTKLWPDATHSLPMDEQRTLDPELLQFWSSHD